MQTALDKKVWAMEVYFVNNNTATDLHRITTTFVALANVHLSTDECKYEETANYALLSETLNQLKAGHFAVVNFGRTKTGKSEFIRALLALPPDLQSALPVQPETATSTVYKVGWGATPKATVFFKPNQERSLLEVRVEDVAAYGTEIGNPENEKDVEAIGIELPLPWLKEGLVIFDTPGTNSLFEEHVEFLWSILPSSNLFAFILDSELPRSEIGVLKQVRDNVRTLRGEDPTIIFVQTKAETNTPDENAEIKEANLQHISSALSMHRAKIPYFVVSSHQKQEAMRSSGHSEMLLDLSGFSTLETDLKNRHSAFLTKMKDQFLRSLRTETEKIGELINSQIIDWQNLLADQETNLNAARHNLELAKRWYAEEYPATFNKLLDDLEDTYNETVSRLRSALVADQLVEPVLNESQAYGSGDLQEKAPRIQSNFIKRCEEIFLEVIHSYTGEVQSLLYKACGDISNSIEEYVHGQSDSGSTVEGSDLQPVPNRDSAPLNTIRTRALSSRPLPFLLRWGQRTLTTVGTGFMFHYIGAKVGGKIGAILGAPLGPLGITVGAVVGAVLGFLVMRLTQETLLKQSRLVEIRRILETILSKTATHSFDELTKLANAAKRTVRDDIDGNVKTSLRKLSDDLAEKEKKSDRETITNEIAKLQMSLGQVRVLLAEIDRLLGVGPFNA